MAFLERLTPIGVIDSGWALWDRLPEWLRRAIASAVLGAIAVAWTWAIAINDFIGQFGPYGYMLAACLALGAVLWILNQLHAWRVRPREISEPTLIAQSSALGRTSPTTTIGARPPDRIIHKNQRILLPILAQSQGIVIQNQIFENCTLVGPAVIMLDWTPMDGRVVFHGALEDYLIPVERNRRVSGIMVLRRCHLTDCAFDNVGIIGTNEYLETIRQGFFRDKKPS